MPSLTVSVSESLSAALAARSQELGDSVDHLVQLALADFLSVEHGTLFQVSTAGALVEGLYHGEVTVGDLKPHGDFGLGTFDGLDGEMIALDGRFYRAGSDLTVNEAADDTRTPFAVVTHFHAERIAPVNCGSFAELQHALDGLRESDNIFYAIRAHGRFERIAYRCACKHEDGVGLAAATADQTIAEMRDVDATLVGFYTPAYVTSIGIPGYHLHVLSDDRTKGGHVFDCAASGLNVELQRELDVRVALPETADFLRADLRGDSTAALAVAETGPSSESEG